VQKIQVSKDTDSIFEDKLQKNWSNTV